MVRTNEHPTITIAEESGSKNEGTDLESVIVLKGYGSGERKQFSGREAINNSDWSRCS